MLRSKYTYLLITLILSLSIIGCSEDSGVNGNVSFDKADLAGTWQIIWDKGESFQESATIVVGLVNGELTASGLINITVSSNGVVGFTDIEGYMHTGQINNAKDFISGVYSKANDSGVWEASKN